MAKPYRSKAIRNLKSVTNSTLRTTGSLTSKGANKVGKWLVTDHTGAIVRSNFIGLEQSINFTLAKMALGNRRTGRLIDCTQRLIDTGVSDSTFETTVGWGADHAIYVFDLLWGFLCPIVSYLLMTILMIVMIVVFNVIFFYALYQLLTH
jgi:hypothetical protein